MLCSFFIMTGMRSSRILPQAFRYRKQWSKLEPFQFEPDSGLFKLYSAVHEPLMFLPHAISLSIHGWSDKEP